MLTLNDVWLALVGPDPAPLGAAGEREIAAPVIDSRSAGPGSLFVALRGERTDGHLYLDDAFGRGAVAAIAERRAMELVPAAVYVLPDGTMPGQAAAGQELPVIFVVADSAAAVQRLAGHWRDRMPAVAVGITGSIGKTTTKEIAANVLAQRYVTLRSQGNLNNELGVPLTLLRLEPEHERVVLEMGMYALGEIARLCELARPRIGVVTNVGPVHLERLGTIERIAEAKAELVRALPPAEEGGVAILNGDDDRVAAMGAMTRARVITYGLGSHNDLWADEIRSQGLEGIRFRLVHGQETMHVRLPMLGRHSVHTALRAAAVGLAEGMSWTEIINGLQELHGQLRLMVVPGLRETTLIDDTYNASPDSMLVALNLLEEIANAEHRSVAVLGGMAELGSYEETGHRVVGGRAAQVVKKLITVGARARWIAEEARALGMSTSDVYPVTSNEDAIGILQGLLRPGDVVLIKGSRSAAMETIVDALSRLRTTGAVGP